MDMTNQSLFSFNAESSSSGDSDTDLPNPGIIPERAPYRFAGYDFIALLGLIQRLKIDFLPVTWQGALGSIGEGRQATINQALANVQMSFAFKLFHRSQQDSFRPIIQEMVALSHPVIQKHRHIVRLEGICWDVSSNSEIWPVLVLQKSRLGDLCRFARSEAFKNVSIGDKLNICADIGIAIRDMHCVIHGDIKPQNVLIFEEDSRFLAKITDFGFSNCFQDDNELISMPKSEPWNAPEHHNSEFLPEQAKQMDVYSFGMLCFWLLFEAGSSFALPVPQDGIQEIDQFMSFEQGQPELSLLQLWKSNGDNELLELVHRLVRQDERFDSDIKNRLMQFFKLTLAFDPQLRSTGFREPLNLLMFDRIWPKALTVQRSVFPEKEDFEISSSIRELYDADFRLREFIVKCLESLVHKSEESTVQHISPINAALQLALSYTIGFGTTKDDDRAISLLNKYSLDYAHLQSRIEFIDNSSFPNGSLLSLEPQSQFINFPQYHQETTLMKRAESVYEHEIQSIQMIFGEAHWLCWSLKSKLAWILKCQGRWKEAEKLEMEVIEKRLKEIDAEQENFTDESQIESTETNQSTKSSLWLWFMSICSPPPRGYKRISYKCGCGEFLYVDLKELLPGGIERFRQRLTKNTSAVRTRPQNLPDSSHSVSTPRVYLNSDQGSLHSNVLQPQHPIAPILEDLQAIDTASQNLNLNVSQDCQYLLLCVNTRNSTALINVEVGSLVNDQYLFQRISHEYQSIRRKHEWEISLLCPLWVYKLLSAVSMWLPRFLRLPCWLNVFPLLNKIVGEASIYKIASGDFVRFQLIPVREKCCPGWFKGRDLPPETEVRAKNYLYEPVPMEVEFANIPLPHLMRPGPHADKFWLTTFPKKLREPLVRRSGSDGQRTIGWGIRINEGLNWGFILRSIFILLVFFGASVIIYATTTSDNSSAFSFGAYLISLFTVYITYQYLAWKEEIEKSPGC